MTEVNTRKKMFEIEVYLLEYLRLIKKESIIQNALGKDNSTNLERINDVKKLISWLEGVLKWL